MPFWNVRRLIKGFDHVPRGSISFLSIFKMNDITRVGVRMKMRGFVCGFLLLLMCQPAMAGKKEIYVSLEKVQTAVSSGVDPVEALGLLNDAGLEILKGETEEGVDKEFILGANICQVSFQMLFNAMTFPDPEVRKLTAELLGVTRSKLDALRAML